MHYEPWAWELVGDVAVGVGEVVIFTPAGVDAHARGLHPPTRMHTHTQATTLIPGRRTARPPILRRPGNCLRHPRMGCNVMTMLSRRSTSGSECCLSILILVLMVGSCTCRMPCTENNQCIIPGVYPTRDYCWGVSMGSIGNSYPSYCCPGCYTIQGYATKVCGYKCCGWENPNWQKTEACYLPPQCAPGTFSTTGYAGMASAACGSCPAGKYAAGTASTVCTNCTAGTYSAAGASVCTNCEAGKYKDSAGINTACDNCTAGKYAAGTASTVCTSCTAGKFSGQVAAASVTVCISCVPGKFSGVEGASSHDTCTDCPPGTYSEMNGASDVTNCTVPQCPAGQAPMPTSADMFEVCSSDEICYKLSNTVYHTSSLETFSRLDVSNSSLEKWTVARIKSWRLGPPGKSCAQVCGEVRLTCHKTRFPRPSQDLTRHLLGTAGFFCSVMSSANNSGVLLDIHSRAPCIDNSGKCWYYEGESQDMTTWIVPESGYGDCESYEETNSRLCPCSVTSQSPTNQAFEVSGTRCETRLDGRYLYLEQWGGKPAYKHASTDRTIYLYFAKGNGNGWWHLSGGLGWTSDVKAKRLGATGGFLESRTTSDDVPDTGWQELCGAGWTETNMVIRANATSSVIGPWKGPSGESLFCMSCPSGTYSATGLTCDPCPAGYTSPIRSTLASQCDQQISASRTSCGCNTDFSGPAEIQVPWYTYRLSLLQATWGSPEFAHCKLSLTLDELGTRYKESRPPKFKIGSLGPLRQPDRFEVWICIEDHFCSNHPTDKVGG